MNLLAHVYAALLHLYPRTFRDEFADEMQSVFGDSIAEAAQHGVAALIALCLQELRDLPGAILRELWQARGKSIMENKPRVSWLELLCAAIPFLLYLSFPMIEGLRFNWGAVVILFLLGALFILMVVGLFKGIPRWSMPGLGLLLAAVNYILLGLVGGLLVALDLVPLPLLREVFGSGFSNVGVIVLTLVVLLITASIRPLRPFFQRVREDWTLVPFALYGVMPLVLYASFDEYQGSVPYEISIGLILLVSLLLYLRNTQPSRKLLALGIGITLAMAVEAIGKWILIPSQSWIDLLQLYPIEQTIKGEVTNTVYRWFWVMVVVFFPALLGLLPRDKQPIPT
jgi:hypothetical protein